MRMIFGLVVALSLCAAGTFAAEPTFPPGSAIGLTPPPGMTASRVFSGFEDRASNSVIIFTKYPPDAFDQVVAGFDDAKLLKAGIAVRTRENLKIGGNPAFLATGNQFIGGSRFHYWVAVVQSSYGTALVSVQYPESAAALYSDADMRAALTSITLRPDPPLTEQ